MRQPPLITTRRDLLAVQRLIGVREDWHEPDEQDVTATVYGHSFDNAGIWPLERADAEPDDQLMGIPIPVATPSHIELHVTLYQRGKPVGIVNLATLFAWATGLRD